MTTQNTRNLLFYVPAHSTNPGGGFYRTMELYSQEDGDSGSCFWLVRDVENEWQSAMYSLMESNILCEEDAQKFLDSEEGEDVAEDLLEMRLGHDDRSINIAVLPNLGVIIEQWRRFSV